MSAPLGYSAHFSTGLHCNHVPALRCQPVRVTAGASAYITSETGLIREVFNHPVAMHVIRSYCTVLLAKRLGVQIIEASTFHADSVA